MENLVEYSDNYTPGIAIGIENVDNNLTFGDGKSYGLELFFAKSAKAITAYLALLFNFM